MVTEIEIDSPFSSTKTNIIWGKKDNQTIYKCRDTGVLFFDRNILDKHNYNEYYPYLKLWDTERFIYELELRRNNYIKQLNDIRKLSNGINLLDTGAGPGYLCKVANEQGWSAQGIEISAEAKTYGRKHFDVDYVEFDNLKDDFYDVIICHHVLEHIDQPIEFLNILRRSLSKDGLLIIHVPHQQPLTFLIRNLINRYVYSSDETFCTLYSNIHITGFTPTSLGNFIENQNFNTVFIKSRSMWSKYYDPFFFGDMVRSHNYLLILKRTIRHLAENAGNIINYGDWVIGYFRKK